MPDVSVVLPVHNRFDFLAEAVASVLNQDWSGSLEVIVVNDGSDTDPRKFLNAMPENVRVVTQENQGVGAARDHGIKLAKAPLIAFQDDDDLWLPNKLSMQCGILERHPAVGMVFSDLVSFSPDGERSVRYSGWWTDLRDCPHTVAEGEDPEVLIFEPDALFLALAGDMRVFHQSSLYRRSYLEQIGGSDPRTPSCGDCIDIALRATHGGQVAYVDAPTFELRRGHGQHLTRDPNWAAKEVREFTQVHEHYPEDLRRAFEPWMARYLKGMAWNSYDAGDWQNASDFYDLAATRGPLSLSSRVKRFLARRRAGRGG